ncbi:Secreted protein [Cladobotryum mycophilum]|uniref:Secreted protein n=1 Tax=Cladobotryum mycophilum TaxID=491253 RepID=A0ABR0S8Y3_9HYPO
MISKSTILGGLLAVAAVEAAQRGAVKPVAGPMRDLTWGQLNFLHTTDTHGWLSGHLLEPQYSADWGDYISFSQHLRNLSDERGSDLLIIDTGDRIEGSGLYDGSDPKGLYQYDIYAQQKVDLISTGNHELYMAYSVDREHDTTVPNFKENYLASNLDYVNSTTGERVPQAKRYRKFKTKNQGIEIVSFGFLFDFTGNADNAIVQRVEETIKEEWFQKAIREKPDLFVVIGHVGLRMDEFKIIFHAIRKENWDTPIAFFGGHMHVRDAVRYDSKSFALASGRYFETIGWMSIDGLKIKNPKQQSSSKTDLAFTRKYMDNNLLGMYYHTGLNETTFPTEDGKRVTKMIEHARKALKLDYRYGCAPRDLWVNRVKYPGKNSIYTWLEEEVIPDIIVNEERKDKPRLAILNTGGIRFDIFKGAFTKDSTFTISPFVSGFRYIPDVEYLVAQKVIKILNSAPKILSAKGADAGVAIPDTSILNIPQERFRMSLEADREEAEEPRLELRGLKPSSSSGDQPLTAGYTTEDDISKDGDDTVHKPLKVYPVPNCVQAEIAFPANGQPDKVDLVFLDFIQPWIIPSLKFSGGDYSDDDVKVYMEGSLTSKLADWIGEHWSEGDC